MIGDKENWIARAKKARAEGLLLSLLEEGFVSLFLFVLNWSIVVCFLSIPIQAAGEAVYWLRYGEFANFDWYDLLGKEYFSEWTATELVGLNKLIVWVLDAWISVVPSAGALVLTIVIALNRKQGF